MNKGKVLGGAVVAIALVVALYFANRYWIAPVATRAKVAASASSDNPLAPDFALPELNGQTLRLSDYRGKVVLLDFWATWCGPCQMEIPGFVQLQNKYRDEGFTVIGVSLDDGTEPVKEFYNEFKMNYPVAMNGSKKVDLLYGGIIGLPTAFLIGRDGRIYAKHAGAQPNSVFEDEVKSLLAVPSTSEAKNFRTEGHAEKGDAIELATPEEVNSEIPGVDISKLTPDQKTQFKKVLASQQCNCNGCKYNLLDCRRLDSTCPVSRKAAKELLAQLLKTGAAPSVDKTASGSESSAPAAARPASARE
ncbi:MAG TPA: TlpA disulfide reductase family protein [Terriglobia bacterium]|nr:TlpA disulfide reductase family protein [Terriglobia bacterium]